MLKNKDINKKQNPPKKIKNKWNNIFKKKININACL